VPRPPQAAAGSSEGCEHGPKKSLWKRTTTPDDASDTSLNRSPSQRNVRVPAIKVRMPRRAAGPAPAKPSPLPARPLADSRPGLKIAKIVIDSGHGRPRHRDHRTQRPAEKDLVLRRFPPPRQTAGDAPGRRCELHPQRRYFHPTGIADPIAIRNRPICSFPSTPIPALTLARGSRPTT